MSLQFDISALYGSLQVIVGAFSAFFAGVAIWLTQHYQSKSQQTTGLIKAFDILNGPEQRNARKQVCKAYAPYTDGAKYSPDDFKLERLPKNDISTKEKIHPEVEYEKLEEYMSKVRSDLDQLGSLVLNKLIPKDAFLDAYWGTTIRCWGALDEFIHNLRIKEENKHVMHNFEELKKLAVTYWEKKYRDEKISYY